jgi:hypothetical protein
VRNLGRSCKRYMVIIWDEASPVDEQKHCVTSYHAAEKEL